MAFIKTHAGGYINAALVKHFNVSLHKYNDPPQYLVNADDVTLAIFPVQRSSLRDHSLLHSAITDLSLDELSERDSIEEAARDEELKNANIARTNAYSWLDKLIQNLKFSLAFEQQR